MRLIDADALKADYQMGDDCNDCPTGWKECQYNHSYTKMDFCGWLDDAPTIKPERKTGRWIIGEAEIGALGIVYNRHYCSICGYSHAFPINLFRYCPGCGAKMEDEKE